MRSVPINWHYTFIHQYTITLSPNYMYLLFYDSYHHQLIYVVLYNYCMSETMTSIHAIYKNGIFIM